jgi:hypothetical protein
VGARIDYKASVAADLRRLDRAAAARLLRKIEKSLAAEGHRGDAPTGEFVGLTVFASGITA